MSRHRVLAQGRRCSEPIRNSASRHHRFLQASARRRRNHDSQSRSGNADRRGVARPRRYPHPQRNRAWVLNGHRAARQRRSRPLYRRGAIFAGGDKTVCVTLGRRGVLALIGGELQIVPGRAVTAVDTTGAGDCFVGALAAQLAGSKSHSRRTALRQHCRFDLRATDGRGAVNADGGRGSGRPLQPSSRRKPGPITPGSSFAEGVRHRRLAERSRCASRLPVHHCPPGRDDTELTPAHASDQSLHLPPVPA